MMKRADSRAGTLAAFFCGAVLFCGLCVVTYYVPAGHGSRAAAGAALPQGQMAYQMLCAYGFPNPVYRQQMEIRIRQLRQALHRNPDDPALHLDLAMLSRDPNSRLNEYREAVRLAPGSVHARFLLADTLKCQGRIGSALTQYREALRRQPRQAITHYELGRLLDQMGKRAQAKAEWRKATVLDDGDGWAAMARERLRGTRG